MFNLFNTENLSFTLRPEQSPAYVDISPVHAAGGRSTGPVRPRGGTAVHGRRSARDSTSEAKDVWDSIRSDPRFADLVRRSDITS